MSWINFEALVTAISLSDSHALLGMAAISGFWTTIYSYITTSILRLDLTLATRKNSAALKTDSNSL